MNIFNENILSFEVMSLEYSMKIGNTFLAVNFIYVRTLVASCYLDRLKQWIAESIEKLCTLSELQRVFFIRGTVSSWPIFVTCFLGNVSCSGHHSFLVP